ncbi:MAG: thiS [Rhizobacter sp.]|nr:thiS [Rhizobacter sp.]
MDEQDTLRVSLDGREVPIPAACSLAHLLSQQGIQPEAVATAVNGDFVPRAFRESRLLEAGDEVLCFKPITGG